MNRISLGIAGWVYGLALLAALIVLSVMAHSTAYFPIDLSMTRAFQALQSPGLDAAALAVDWLGYVPQIAIIMAIVGLGLILTGYRWEGAVLWVGGIVEAAVDGSLKLLVRRPRPEGLGIHIYQPLGDFTYPSGHAFSYVMVFGLLAYFCWRLVKIGWLRALLMAMLIALVVAVGPVRIYLGEHWPSDVLAGYLLGALFLPLIILLYHWGEGRFFKHKPR